MSDLLGNVMDEKCTRTDCSTVDLLIEPHEKDLGGFTVRRCLPAPEQKMVGPFIFFDHAGPADFAPGDGIDVRPHPHINLATITYLFAGEILHRDSLGEVQPIRPGEINLMVAGRGIVHSERTGPETRAAGHTLHALQLWLALPAEHEEVEPSFHHYAAAELPVLQRDGITVRLMIGEAYGLTSPVRTFSPTLYLEASLEAGASLEVPDTVSERGVYIVSGELKTKDTRLSERVMAVLSSRPGTTLTATRPTRLAIIGGEPLGKRTIWWNFVSSRPERIRAAGDDWQNGRFPVVPGETEFIPLPD